MPKKFSNYGEFAWGIAIFEKNSSEHFAAYKFAGSLIHPQVVLTSAHNLYERDPSKLILRGGVWNIFSSHEAQEHQDRYVRDVITHPEFNYSSGDHDIALILLNTPFTIRENIRTICLANERTRIQDHECLSAAWGKETWNDDFHTSLMKKVVLEIVPHQQCQTSLGNQFSIGPSHVCAKGTVDLDTCLGDGGSALFCGELDDGAPVYYQHGVTAYGNKCSNKLPGIYTSIPFHRDWIDHQFHRLNLTKHYYTHTAGN